MSFKPESFTVPNQVVHCLIITRTHTHQIFNYSKSTEMRSNTASNVQIKPLTQCKQSFSPPFGPQTRAKKLVDICPNYFINRSFLYSCKKFNPIGPKNKVILEYEKISFEWKFSNFLMFKSLN
jgi:hypothetical protein